MKTRSIFFCLAAAFSTNTFITVYAQAVNKQDSLALVDLYNSTDCPNWVSEVFGYANWLEGPVATWVG